jgi:oligopeptide/dipeptide ABC transporter ATP-binding protein
MYLGHIVELTDRKTLFANPLHPYTQSLASAVPIPNPKLERQRRQFMLGGEPPSPANPPPGCVFHPRCPLTLERCRVEAPALREVEGRHLVACHRADQAGGSKTVAGEKGFAGIGGLGNSERNQGN